MSGAGSRTDSVYESHAEAESIYPGGAGGLCGSDGAAL